MANTDYYIAITGMAGRFPKAENTEQFWMNLLEGRDCIERNSSFDTPTFKGAYGRIDHLREFDAGFFGYTDAEAINTDPEQRIITEVIYHALEDAGSPPEEYMGKTGLYLSFDNGIYIWNNIMQKGGDWYNEYQIYKAYLSTRAEKVAYTFGFEGPAVMSEYACASSLNTVHQACQALLNYECDMAVAGGVFAEPEQNGYISMMATESSGGVMRPFDRDADGLIPGSAAGAVVLKRYDDAKAAHDNIISVIKGTFVNSDGRRKAGFAAPSVIGQQECLMSVMNVAETEPDDIIFYQAHGTATELGDAIELKAIKNVMNGRIEPLTVGSVKANIGHTSMAAGISNVIAAALVLKNRTFVPTINYENPCSELTEKNCCLRISTSAERYTGEKPMQAVCSAIGLGGVNAMAVMSEYTSDTERGASPAISQLLLFSGKTAKAAEELKKTTNDYIVSHGVRTDDAAYTLQTGRAKYNWRTFSLAGTPNSSVIRRRAAEYDSSKKRRTVFVFSGVGSFDRTVGKELYLTFPIFRSHMDHCFELTEKAGVYGVREYFLNFMDNAASPDKDNIRGIQVIFSLGWSLARTLIDIGIKPDAVIGHSNGEYVAAAVSGILEPSDAVRLLNERAKLMEELPEGAMINVAGDRGTIEGVLPEGMWIGAENGPNRFMITGYADKADEFTAALAEKGVMFSRAAVNRASHCEIMLGIADRYLEILNEISFSAPVIPFYSSYTEDIRDSAAEVVKPEYWVRQMSEPVRFQSNVVAADDESPSLFIELGTGDAPTSMIRKFKTGKEYIPAYSAFDSPTCEDSRDGFLAFLGDLWCNGYEPDWEKLYEEKPFRTELPLYPFERRTYWKYRPDLSMNVADTIKEQVESVVPADDSKEETLTETDTALIAIVEEVIGEGISMDDNLYDKGMDSLSAMLISSKIQTEFGLNVQLSDMYRFKTTRDISEFLTTADKLESQASGMVEAPEMSFDDLLDEIDNE